MNCRLVRLIIGIVERGGFGDCGLRRELRTPVTAVRVVRIHLIDGDEVYQHIYRQERWDKSALTRCAPQSTPLRLPLRHTRPLPTPSKLLPPLASPSRALGTLAKLTSVTEITGIELRGNVGKGRDNGKGLLERREKKRQDDEEGRGGGVGIGQTFEKRRVMEGRVVKKARKSR